MARLISTANKNLGETDPISAALYKNGGDIILRSEYWTSTEALLVMNGQIIAQEKFHIAKVRAIRAF